MKLRNVILYGCAILSVQKSFSQGQDQYKVVVVRNIKELQSNGDIPYLKTYPIDEFTQEKRLNLCREGFEHIPTYHQVSTFKEKFSFLDKTYPETFKLYVVIDSELDEATILPAYKCPTDPATYIQVMLNEGDKSQPIFQVICKVSRPHHTIDLIKYELELVEDIVQVNGAEFSGSMKFPQNLPDFDLDAFSEVQRRQICEKAKQTVPLSDMKLLADTKISPNKYYRVTSMMYAVKKIEEALECPTEPKIYVAVRRGEINFILKFWTMMKASDDYRETVLRTSKKLKAISDKKIAEPLYLKLKETSMDTDETRLIDPRTQHALCETIFKDSILHKYVNISGRTHDDLDYIGNVSLNDAYSTLKNKNPKLYKRFYKSSDSILVSGKDVVIVGGTDSIDVSVSGTQEKTQEDVLACLIRPTVFYQDIQEYYISKEYNVNTSKDSSDDYVTGRFVFTKNPDSNELEIVAMAEEYASASKIENIELFYLERRKNNEPEKLEFNDPLCQLSSSERSRLCSIVFDYFIITKKTVSLQNFGCAKNPITFTTRSGKEKANGDVYYEYMIPCYVTETRYGVPKMFYLSRAYNPKNSNEVFAYSHPPMSAEIVLQNLYDDVRIGSFLTKK